ncbi:YggT family protein [Ligilactobacillus sp. WC1T17]|uniref:YggT family protein n=1 Tax=Ligilactobacillus ruminis TaxID=1623 RepID=A0ABY1AAX9_9LACO|nr:YggT family protein [Ligilactobacillus ruminis]
MLTLIVADLFRIYGLLIVVYCFLSWFPNAQNSKFGYYISRICEPYLSLFDFIPPIAGISFSPIIALIVLDFVERGLLLLMGILGIY